MRGHQTLKEMMEREILIAATEEEEEKIRVMTRNALKHKGLYFFFFG